MSDRVIRSEIEIPPGSRHFENVTLKTSVVDENILIIEVIETGLIGYREVGSPDVIDDKGEDLFRIIVYKSKQV